MHLPFLWCAAQGQKIQCDTLACLMPLAFPAHSLWWLFNCRTMPWQLLLESKSTRSSVSYAAVWCLCLPVSIGQRIVVRLSLRRSKLTSLLIILHRCLAALLYYTCQRRCQPRATIAHDCVMGWNQNESVLLCTPSLGQPRTCRCRVFIWGRPGAFLYTYVTLKSYHVDWAG